MESAKQTVNTDTRYVKSEIWRAIIWLQTMLICVNLGGSCARRDKWISLVNPGSAQERMEWALRLVAEVAEIRTQGRLSIGEQIFQSQHYMYFLLPKLGRSDSSMWMVVGKTPP